MRGLQSCKTKYPLVLVHGIGYNDKDYPDYWGRVPGTLRNHGATVYFGGQDSYGRIRENGEQLLRTVQRICRQEGTEKVNIIAHSKGGIEARYMISLPEGEALTASLTTIATPHRGLSVIDELKEKSPRLLRRLYDLFALMIRVDGGDRPEGDGVYDQLTADYMEVFNRLVPDSPGVYYQSYACDMVDRKVDPALGLFHDMILKREGPNDGLVSVKAAGWGDFRGVYLGPEGTGISHPMACDGRVRRMEKKGMGDVSLWYVSMVEELKEKGY